MAKTFWDKSLYLLSLFIKHIVYRRSNSVKRFTQWWSNLSVETYNKNKFILLTWRQEPQRKHYNIYNVADIKKKKSSKYFFKLLLYACWYWNANDICKYIYIFFCFFYSLHHMPVVFLFCYSLSFVLVLFVFISFRFVFFPDHLANGLMNMMICC